MSLEYPCVYYDNQKCKKFEEPGYVSWCVLGPCSHETPSNADHIRSMTDEELAKLLLDGCRGSKCEDKPENEWGSVNCFQCRMDWLKQPYKEEDNG